MALPDADKAEQAALFTERTLKSFAQVIAPGFAMRVEAAARNGLEQAPARVADSIGRLASALPTTEALHIITSLYPALVSPDYRGAVGAFYTPPVLSVRLIDQATEEGIDWRTARVLDPAAGGGAFLIQAAEKIRSVLRRCEASFVLAQIGSRLRGFEIDANAAAIAQAALEVQLADLSIKSGRRLSQIVRVCNSLDEIPEERFDLVIGNPPYGRITLTPRQRERYKRSLYGHANLYGVFTDIALRWTKPGGVVAYLTPTSFLAGQYYSTLRGLLAEEAPPVAIDFVHARRGVFEDVLQETMLAIYRKGKNRQRMQIHYLNVTNEREARITRNGTVGLPQDANAPWLAPRDPEHGILISRVEAMAARLSDWGYSVATGPLVWNRFKPQLRGGPGDENVHPLIWAESVTADGRFVFRANKKNHAPFFKLQLGDGWLLVDKPCVLVQRTTAKEQSRRLIAAELPVAFIRKYSGVVVENHLNMVRSSGNPKVSAAVVAALLNSRVVDQVFRCMNGSVAVSAFELEAVPLPDPSDLAALTELVTRGADRTKIEAECDRLYLGKA